ncbi:MAG: DNA mismatch repair protein MutS, partial [Pseudoflavonifractor sp.]
MPADTTPMMVQYLKMKALHPDCLLFFRLGDFYEMFQEDAKTASRELDLTLTSRDRSKPLDERTPMCGVPYHSADAYIARLIAKGYKVAICEQMEDPALAKGLVDRDIIRIVTPGTVMDASMLEEGRNNYICALYQDSQGAGLAFCDISTGEFTAAPYLGDDRAEHLYNDLGAYKPREAVLSGDAYSDTALRAFLEQRLDCRCEEGGEARFRPDVASETLKKNLRKPPENGKEDGAELALQAAGGLLSYLYETQKTDLSHIAALALNLGKTRPYMELDLTARRNLELTETLRGKEKRGSLLWVLDKTKTPMGHRLIRTWLEQPLLSPVTIGRRLEAVGALVDDSIRRGEIICCLREITDLERLIGRIVYGVAGGRDLVALATGLGKLPQLREQLTPLSSALLSMLTERLDDLPNLRDLVSRAIDDEPPFSVREGGFIKAGYNPDVDYLRDIMQNGKGMVAAIEAREKEKTGIKGLKVGYNRVFGYYIEISKSYYDQVPEDYIRKQTLANCERFITQELKEMEHTILSAQDKITALEYQLFSEVRQEVAGHVQEIQTSAGAVAALDVIASFASVAADNGYCMPQVDLSDKLEITEGRHPVVEKMLKNSLFVPNDTQMDSGENLVAIITGPNMAGKSTYMRQVALIALMAQMGSFVPAK